MRLFLLIMLLALQVHATDVMWEGLYRSEGVSVVNPTFFNPNGPTKSYLSHHLILNPKIVAMDGLNLYGRLDIFIHAFHSRIKIALI